MGRNCGVIFGTPLTMPLLKPAAFLCSDLGMIDSADYRSQSNFLAVVAQMMEVRTSFADDYGALYLQCCLSVFILDTPSTIGGVLFVMRIFYFHPLFKFIFGRTVEGE
jgi:hypothetical protein